MEELKEKLDKANEKSAKIEDEVEQLKNEALEVKAAVVVEFKDSISY